LRKSGLFVELVFSSRAFTLTLACALFGCVAMAQDGVGVTVYAQGQPVNTPATVERRPALNAADIIDASLLHGPDYDIAASITWQGQLAVFSLHTKYGDDQAIGAEELMQRLAELPAVAEIDRISKLKAFASAASSSLEKTGSAVWHVLRHPKQTIQGVPDGIKRKAGKLAESVKEGSKNLADKARDGMADDPLALSNNWFLPPRSADSAPGEMDPDNPPPTEQQRKTWQERTQRQAERAGLSYIGYSSARRDLTKRLQVDPYTSNPLIQSRLDSLAWSAWAGGKGAGMALGAATGGASIVVSKSKQLNNLVWEKEADDLRKLNRKALKDVGFGGPVARAFIRNRAFTPTQQGEMTAHLVSLSTVDGAFDLLALISRIDDPLEARMTLNAMSMTEAARGLGEGVRSIRVSGANVWFVTSKNRILVPAPVDYCYLHPPLVALLKDPRFSAGDRTILVQGQISEHALMVFSSAGWAVQDHAPYAGGPIYVRY
jgi:hypothetical protein